MNLKMIKTMHKLLVFFVIVIFLTEVAYAFNASSDDYSLNSYHTGLAGGNVSSSEYNSRFSSTYQQSGGKGENGNYTANIGFFSQPEFCGDDYCNADETCSTCPVDCGTCPSVPSEAPSAPAVAGAGAVCTYDWVCSEWYPEPCPSEGIQKRVCVNRGTCSGTLGIPSLTKTCIPEFIPPSEPLFDLFLRIPFGKKWISRGDTLEAQVELTNVGNITTIDVFFKYWIVDENNRLILERQETRAIGEREKFSVWFSLPKDLKPGAYKIYVHITYDNKVALAGDSFEVFESRLLIIKRIAFLSLILLSVILGLIILLRILKRRKERKRKVKQRLTKRLTRRLLRAEKRRLRKIRRKRKRRMKELRRAERKRKRKYRIKRREREREIKSMERKRRLKKIMRKLRVIPEKKGMRKPKKRRRKFRIKRKIKIPKHKRFKRKAKPRRKKEKISHEEIERLRKKVYEDLLKKTVEMKQARKIPKEGYEDLGSKIENLRGEIRKKGIKEAQIHKKKNK